MKRLKKFFAISAAIFCAYVPNSTFAAEVSDEVKTEVEVKVEVEVSTDSQSKSYSGVIVDCRGLGLQTAASPVIKTESGKIIYGDKDLDFDKINEIGMAAYATSIEDSTGRVGMQPLIIRAVSVDQMKSNPVLKDMDAEKIVIANAINDFLKDLKVVFLTD